MNPIRGNLAFYKKSKDGRKRFCEVTNSFVTFCGGHFSLLASLVEMSEEMEMDFVHSHYHFPGCLQLHFLHELLPN